MKKKWSTCTSNLKISLHCKLAIWPPVIYEIYFLKSGIFFELGNRGSLREFKQIIDLTNGVYMSWEFKVLVNYSWPYDFLQYLDFLTRSMESSSNVSFLNRIIGVASREFKKILCLTKEVKIRWPFKYLFDYS